MISKKEAGKINRPLPLLPIYKAAFLRGNRQGWGAGREEYCIQCIRAAPPPISILINITHLGARGTRKGPVA